MREDLNDLRNEMGRKLKEIEDLEDSKAILIDKIHDLEVSLDKAKYTIDELEGNLREYEEEIQLRGEHIEELKDKLNKKVSSA